MVRHCSRPQNKSMNKNEKLAKIRILVPMGVYTVDYGLCYGDYGWQ